MTIVIPEASTATLAPTDQRSAELFGRVADSVREHGVTPEQAEALTEVCRAACALGHPSSAVRELADTLTAQTATVSPVFTDDGRIHLGPFIDRYLCDADARTKNTDLAKMAGLADAQSLMAQARAQFPRVVIETATLDADTPVRFKQYGNLWRFCYDPAQYNRAQAEVVINIHIAGSSEYVEYALADYEALRPFEEFRTSDGDPRVMAFWDEFERQVLDSDDPAATVARISQLLAREHRTTLDGRTDGAAGGRTSK